MSRLKTTEEIVGLKEFQQPNIYKSLAAEFLGTMFLVLFGCGSAMKANVTALEVSFAFGFIVIAIVQAIGHISGGHINPSVSVGMVVARYISILRFLLYILVQCLGAYAGAGILYAITPDDKLNTLGASALGDGIARSQAFGVEVLATFVLVLVIFASTDERRRDLKGSTAVIIGFAVFSTHLFAIPYSGGSLNPARSFGPALVIGDVTWKSHWIYWTAPPLGAAIASVAYQFIFRAEKAEVDYPAGMEAGAYKNGIQLSSIS